MLLRIYGSALLQVGNHHVSMRAFRARPGDIEVMVRTQVASSVGGDPIPLGLSPRKDRCRVEDL